MNCIRNSINLCIFDHHLIKKQPILLEQVVKQRIISNTNIRKVQKISFIVVLWTIFQYFWFRVEVNIFFTTNVTVDTKLRVFQYKILKNILFVNKMLFKVRKVQSPSYPYCKRKDETYIHLFYRYGKTSILWKQLQSFFSNTLSLFSISLQSATFGFLDDALEYKHLLNDILLILLI